MRRILFIVFAFVLTLFSTLPAFAEMPIDMGTAKAALLIERSSGKVLLGENTEASYSVAGLSRLPALLLVCEALDKGELSLQQQIRVSETAASAKGTSAFLEAYETLSASVLLKAAAMILAGDAIYALCEALSASQEILVSRINERLSALGISVQYSDLLGSDVSLSAMDIAALGNALCESTAYRSFSMLYNDSLVHEDGRHTDITSANKLLKSCTGCIGGLTGSSQEAGYCGVFMVQRGQICYIAVVIGAQNATERAKVASELVEYAFSAFSVKTLAREGEVLVRDIPVIGGTQSRVDLVATENITLVARNTEYTLEKDIPESLTAPLTQGARLGSIRYIDSQGECIAEVELTVTMDVPVARMRDHFLLILRQWVFA